MSLSPPNRAPLSGRPVKVGQNPHARLDPLGIYGTRTAARLQSARRRQRLQRNLFALLVVALLVAAYLFLRLPRTSSLAPQWSRALALQPAAAPALVPDGQTLLVPTQGGLLYAVSVSPTATDAPRAVFKTAFPLQAQPVCSRNLAFVPCQDGAIYGVDWQKSKVVWRFGTSAALTTRPVLVPLQSPTPREIVVLGNDEGRVVALEAKTGKQLWTRKMGGPVGQSLAASGGAKPLVFVPFLAGVAARGGLACLDAASGALKWRFPTGATIFSAALCPPAIESDASGTAKKLYFATDEGALFFLDAQTGKKIGWQKTFATPLPAHSQNALISLRGAPVLVGDSVIVGGNDGVLRAYETDSGKLRWIFETGAPLLQPVLPLESGQQTTVLAGGENGAWTLDAATGAPTKRWKTGGAGFAIFAEPKSILWLAPDGDLKGFAPTV